MFQPRSSACTVLLATGFVVAERAGWSHLLRSVAVIALGLFVMACATPQERELNYWKARGTWVATQEGFNQFLRVDNAQVENCYQQCSGEVACQVECRPWLKQSGRQVANGIVDEAELLFVELEGKVQDDSYAQEVMTGLGRASALGLRLMLIYTTAETAAGGVE